MKIVSLILIAAAFAGLFYYGINAILSAGALDAARRENEELKARRDALREEAFLLGARANELLERGRTLAPASEVGRDWQTGYLSPPSSSAPNDQIISWLSREGAQLEALGVELSTGDERHTLQPEPRELVLPAIDLEMPRARDLDLSPDIDTAIAKHPLRQTGDSS